MTGGTAAHVLQQGVVMDGSFVSTLASSPLVTAYECINQISAIMADTATTCSTPDGCTFQPLLSATPRITHVSGAEFGGEVLTLHGINLQSGAHQGIT